LLLGGDVDGGGRDVGVWQMLGLRSRAESQLTLQLSSFPLSSWRIELLSWQIKSSARNWERALPRDVIRDVAAGGRNKSPQLGEFIGDLGHPCQIHCEA
jgi:hypothetical protein